MKHRKRSRKKLSKGCWLVIIILILALWFIVGWIIIQLELGGF